MFFRLIIGVFSLALSSCATIQEIIECERNMDKTYPSAVSNCQQSVKEYNAKTDPTIERMKR